MVSLPAAEVTGAMGATGAMPATPSRSSHAVLGWMLALALLGLPLVEVWLLILADLPLWLTLLWCGISAGIGWRFAHREDLSLWSDLESDVRNGRLPTIEGVEAMLIVLGGWGLVIPGYLTDILGFALLIPPFRQELTKLSRRAIRLYQG